MALSPTSSRGGGSSSPVIAREYFLASQVTIANGGIGRCTWDQAHGDPSYGPNTLLDRTVDDVPTVIATGVYSVAVTVAVFENMTANGSFQVTLELDSDNEQASITCDSAPATASDPQPTLAVTLIWYIPAGGSLRLKVRNRDGAATRPFALVVGQIQRLS